VRDNIAVSVPSKGWIDDRKTDVTVSLVKVNRRVGAK
jgi:hypothetical protein